MRSEGRGGATMEVSARVDYARTRIIASMLSNRMASLKPSPTMAITAKVRELAAAGKDVIGFGAGEPDFATPEIVREAGIQAIREGFTRYTAGPGIVELREAICEKLLTDNGVTVSASEVIVSAGAKQCIYNALMALVNPGDEVILVSPFWMTYADQVLLAGGVPVVVTTTVEQGFVPGVEQIEEAITDKTKAIVINSPSNPTGAVYPEDVLRGIAALAVSRGMWIISDEIYEKLLYDGFEHVSVASFGPEVAERTLTVGGLSKSFAMTGWRIGYAAGPKGVIDAMATIQDQVTSNACSISQRAAIAALRADGSVISEMVEEFDKRRCVLMSELSRLPGVRFARPHGAFYVFADFSEAVQEVACDDVVLAQHLLESQYVACVPGSVFGGPNHLRLTYTVSCERVAEGVARIREGLKSLR